MEDLEHQEQTETEEVVNTSQAPETPHVVQTEAEEVNPSSDSISSLNIKQTDIILDVGKRGSGKSNLAKTLCKGLISGKCPIAFVDPLQEHTAFKKYGCQNFYIPYGDRHAFENLLKKLLGVFKGILFVDEADGFLPNGKDLLPYQKHAIHLGRHYGIGFIFVTRRLSNLNTDVVSQTTHLFSFRLFAGADAQYLENAQLGELVPHIWKLEKYEFVYYSAEKDEIIISPPIPKFQD